MIRVRVMTFDDLELGLRLRQQADWNQTVADWARFLRLQPDGCFVAELDGTPCGTATTCVMGTVAWIGMMLVDPALRRQGIGKALMTHALAYLEAGGVRSVRLDATAMGAPLYRSLGFVDQFELGRFGGIPTSVGPSPAVEPALPADWESLCTLDRTATNTDRRTLLLSLFREYPAEVRVVRREGILSGYVTARRGLRAWMLGPCVVSPETGSLLLTDALHRHVGHNVFADVPLSHAEAVRLVTRHGLSQQRTLLRMCRGEPVAERIAELWASSGPEKG